MKNRMYQFKLCYMAYARLWTLQCVVTCNKPILDFAKPITIYSPTLPVEAASITMDPVMVVIVYVWV